MTIVLGFDDLLGKFEENNVLADPRTTQKVASAGKSGRSLTISL